MIGVRVLGIGALRDLQIILQQITIGVRADEAPDGEPVRRGVEIAIVHGECEDERPGERRRQRERGSRRGAVDDATAGPEICFH